jgi:hypothetical protein
MLGGSCGPCCETKWVCQCDCSGASPSVAYPASVTVEISGAPVFSNTQRGNTWTLNGKYELIDTVVTSYAGSSYGFSDADGDTCCIWETQTNLYQYTSYLLGNNDPFFSNISLKGQKLFVSHDFPYKRPDSNIYWARAGARYTSANMLLNDTLCRRQTASGALEVSSQATATVTYSDSPPASPSDFSFSWKLTFPA